MNLHGNIRNGIGCVLLLLVCVLIAPLCSAAAITEEYPELSQNEVREYIKSSEYQVDQKESRLSPIDCFAVREDQAYAVGYYAGGRRNSHRIAVYDRDNTHLYSISFEAHGAFDIAWEKDELLVYLYRGGCILDTSADGQCKTIFDAENWEKTDPDSLFKGATNKAVSAKAYFQDPYVYRVSRTSITRIAPDGSREVIYKASAFYVWLPLILILLFLAAWTNLLVVLIKRSKNRGH